LVGRSYTETKSYFKRFTAPWTVSGTTLVSQYQKPRR